MSKCLAVWEVPLIQLTETELLQPRLSINTPSSVIGMSIHDLPLSTQLGKPET